MSDRTRTHGQTDLSGQRVAIVGLGASGVAAARLILSHGGHVYASDLHTDAQAAARGAELERAGALVELGRHDVGRIAGCDLVVVSPGIPPHAPVLSDLRARGVRWISEPELAVRFYSGPLIAVTGTNGKTTTTLLISHLLREGGARVATGGNVGGGLAPAASELALESGDPDWYVLEMSSFQLSAVETFRPTIGVLTNLSPDHLDWYDDVEDYYADKAKLFANAGPESIWILPAGDERALGLIGKAEGTRLLFGETETSGAHAFVQGGTLVLRAGGPEVPLIDEAEFGLLGRHNVLNALAAALAAHSAGTPPSAIAEGLRSARPLPHRLEPVVERAGVLWVNDSKATNVAATRSALESLDRPIVLLLGGKDKGESFAPLTSSMAGRVRTVLAFGAVGPRIAQELEGTVELELMGRDFDAVVRRARAIAQAGDIVLLAPACSSFDMFESYEHRGREFAALAKAVA